MIEAGADRISDDVMYNAIMAGHEANQTVIEFIKKIQKEVGKEKFLYDAQEPSEEMYDKVKELAI